jgi:hypothetical protein
MTANQTTFLFVFQRRANRPIPYPARKSNGQPDSTGSSRTAPLKNKKNVPWGTI